ncbi:MAG: hypothetical protein IJD93_01400 [Ruminococcus sp.]|nr:hypothetical protein [Ruminococcus sp.]
MKTMKKITALLLAVLMLASLCACTNLRSSKAEWGYKTDAQEYAIGVYNYSLFSAYNQAYSVISQLQGEDFDSEVSILDISATFDEAKGEEKALDFILSEADYITKNIIAIDNLIAENGIELDAELEASALEQAKKDWYLGSYYEEYMAYGYTAAPYKDMLEPYGVSFESFYESSYLASVKQNAIFDFFYAKGGEKEVPEGEIKNYFEDNYTSYSYFTANLYESTTDATTGETVNKALSAEDQKKAKEDLELYVKMIAQGSSFDDISKAHTAAANLSANPAISNVENLENTALGEEVKIALEGMKDGEAKVIYVGAEDTTVAYFLYKKPITQETVSYVASETNYDALLKELKGDEFLDYIDSLTASVECTRNESVIAKFNPAIFEEEL